MRVNHYHEEPVWAYAAGLYSLRMCEVHTMAFETATIASGGPVWKDGVRGPWTSLGITVVLIAPIPLVIFHHALNQLLIG